MQQIAAHELVTSLLTRAKKLVAQDDCVKSEKVKSVEGRLHLEAYRNNSSTAEKTRHLAFECYGY